MITRQERKIKMKEYREPLSIEVEKYERVFTESGKALIKEITSKTPYTEAPRCPEPNGTLRFGIPETESDNTSYWIEVTGWKDEVIGYRCGNGQGCFTVEDFKANTVEDFINDKIKFN
jgi:hypothetical protein